MNIAKIAVSAVFFIFINSAAIASSSHDNNIQVRPSLYSNQYSETDKQLVSTLMSQIKSDSKLSGLVEIDGHNGNISISGRVGEVTMIYRIVEIIRKNSDVKSIDVRELDT